MLFGSSSGHPRKLPLSPSAPPPRRTAIYCARQRNSSGRSTEIAGPEDISTTHECEILVLGRSPLSDRNRRALGLAGGLDVGRAVLLQPGGLGPRGCGGGLPGRRERGETGVASRSPRWEWGSG